MKNYLHLKVTLMKLIKLIVVPKSPFASLPKGDTIFGMFAKILFSSNQTNKLKDYLQNQNIIFSDFLYDGFVHKPTMPIQFFGIAEDSVSKKEFKKQSLLAINKLNQPLSDESFLKMNDNFYVKERFARNTVSRNNGKHENNSLFVINATKYQKDLVVYIAFNEEVFTEAEIKNNLELIGQFGFGRRSSVGYGQFEVKNAELDLTNWKILGKSINNGIDTNNPSFLQGVTIAVKIKLDEKFKEKLPSQNVYLTLAPSIPNSQDKLFYSLYTKLGKYGNDINIIMKQHSIMADSGAVYFQ